MLCGDPQQLGPVVHSPVAAGAGLGTSLLERWMWHHSAAEQLYASQVRPGAGSSQRSARVLGGRLGVPRCMAIHLCRSAKRGVLSMPAQCCSVRRDGGWARWGSCSISCSRGPEQHRMESCVGSWPGPFTGWGSQHPQSRARNPGSAAQQQSNSVHSSSPAAAQHGHEGVELLCCRRVLLPRWSS